MAAKRRANNVILPLALRLHNSLGWLVPAQDAVANGVDELAKDEVPKNCTCHSSQLDVAVCSHMCCPLGTRMVRFCEFCVKVTMNCHSTNSDKKPCPETLLQGFFVKSGTNRLKFEQINVQKFIKLDQMDLH